MSFFKTKAFKTTAIVSGCIIALCMMVFGLGYNEATNIIKEFEKDFKLVFETDEYKNLIVELKKTEIAGAGCGKQYKVFKIFKLNHKINRQQFLEIFEYKKNSEVEMALSNINQMKSFDIELSKFSNIVKNDTFLAKIGFWLKGKHYIKEIYRLSEFIHQKLKYGTYENEENIIIFNIVNRNEVKGYRIKGEMGAELNFCSDSFIFNPLKIGNDTFTSSDIIIYIFQKLRK